ncbi:MAG: aminoacetone oxidase family FAD-binding enzyme [endosymbiont of Galathealinum brachiosum]|uniref:Aminoacetone oxidase family FAD-binding enzyme n=1 Tax=endosymbiont of Galathealinum brachiosum TaxID=2200906 RepID=A0A370DDT0_9GAMM|nr:MAG: aminoacetone oxidase family FAD-binding enzyme [endosymbiont of Galathealinum brachiosum]
MKNHYDVIVIGAGAAGLFCAFNSAIRNKRVLVLDHANKVGKKILMSGGGRCNFTNLNTMYDDFTSENIHFVKSALNQYSAYDYLNLVESHNIEYVEKSPGQLFCKNSSKDILKMLLDECAKASVKIFKKCSINKINKSDIYSIETNVENYTANSLVVATGGLSIPTLGATGFGYEIAQQFGHKIVKTNASLVPFTLSKKILDKQKELSGVSLPVLVSNKNHNVEDDLLFTHRGLSGPAILKMSVYWKFGEEILIDLLPSKNIKEVIKSERLKHPDKLLINSLSVVLPKRLVLYLCNENLKELKLKQLDKPVIDQLVKTIHEWTVTPSGTEGYKTAEVTSGGISTEDISSKTLESKLHNNLYFIGEVLDVTGQLGGYNFQWAWSSAWCASQAVK